MRRNSPSIPSTTSSRHRLRPLHAPPGSRQDRSRDPEGGQVPEDARLDHGKARTTRSRSRASTGWWSSSRSAATPYPEIRSWVSSPGEEDSPSIWKTALTYTPMTISGRWRSHGSWTRIRLRGPPAGLGGRQEGPSVGHQLESFRQARPTSLTPGHDVTRQVGDERFSR